MEREILNIEVNTTKTYLSSLSRIYKTERFLFLTKKISSINFFTLKIGEGLQNQIEKLKAKVKEGGLNRALKVETLDGSFCFYLILGYQASVSGLSSNDLIFLYAGEMQNIKQNDQRVNFFLKSSKLFSVRVSTSEYEFNQDDLKKLYLISSSEFVNFPLLSTEQYKLVEIENENVLVQGVAGSGKTNICYGKILFTASRNYSGKILYTTFSRGLLVDTKNKIELFNNSIKMLIDDYKSGRIVFLDSDHKKAIENRLGIFIVADNETNIIKKLQVISSFLESQVEYKLIEDIYGDYFSGEVNLSNEEVFEKEFLKSLNNHQLKSRLERLKDISIPVIFKEIYGMIFGSQIDVSSEMLSLEEYKSRRRDSFSESECEVIYEIAMLYNNFKKTQNLLDYNEMSRKILKNGQKLLKYSLVIADEVQDFTAINLLLLKNLTLKLFCVGDALQMINPTYFSFARLKQLMYNEDVTNVVELESNYRNNKRIVEVLDNLSKINEKQFGIHSFVLKNKSIDEGGQASLAYCTSADFLTKLQGQKFEDFTFLVTDNASKQKLREKFPRNEILTISEIKGLERETVVLVNILSSNSSKWEALERLTLNRKKADENSVYRYYFNLFYVGLSRAKHNVFVFESKPISLFNDFFKENFDSLDASQMFERFSNIVSKFEIEEDEIYVRIDEFIRLGQFDNAKFYAKKLGGVEEFQQLERIDAYKDYIFKGKNKQAGIKLWKAGLTQEAKEQFLISGDTKLIDFLESVEANSRGNLDGEVVRFWRDFEDNPDAKELIIETLKGELSQIKQTHNVTKKFLSKFKENKNGR